MKCLSKCRNVSFDRPARDFKKSHCQSYRSPKCIRQLSSHMKVIYIYIIYQSLVSGVTSLSSTESNLKPLDRRPLSMPVKQSFATLQTPVSSAS